MPVSRHHHTETIVIRLLGDNVIANAYMPLVVAYILKILPFKI